MCERFVTIHARANGTAHSLSIITLAESTAVPVAAATTAAVATTTVAAAATRRPPPSNSTSTSSPSQDSSGDIEEQLLQACSEADVTVAQIQSLLQQDPSAVRCQTQQGMTPLHICCWKGASVDVVDYLIQQWPESIHSKTIRNWIPLHVACASEHSVQTQSQLNVVKCLIGYSRESVKAKDNKERVPLHIASFSGAPVQVVDYLVRAWPESTGSMNNYASLPLHLACGSCAKLEIIQYLAKASPETLYAVDSEGRTPFYLARKPLHSEEPNHETVEWLEGVLGKMEQEKREQQGRFKKERSKLKQVITGERDKPVAVSVPYVETIMSSQTLLGKGYFGIVMLGEDSVLKQQFAVKSINRKILVGGTKDDLERVKKEFKKEQKVRVWLFVLLL